MNSLHLLYPYSVPLAIRKRKQNRVEDKDGSMAVVASELHWVPETLYNATVSCVVVNFKKFRKELPHLPQNVQFDIYYKLYKQGSLCQLSMEFSDLTQFEVVLKVSNVRNKRNLLHHCFQALMDHGMNLATILADAFGSRAAVLESATYDEQLRGLHLGLLLGDFLSEAGWFLQAEKTYNCCLKICQQHDDLQSQARVFECCTRLIHVQTSNCRYGEAETSYQLGTKILDSLQNSGIRISAAVLEAEKCALLFSRSHYDEAYQYCIRSLKAVNNRTPIHSIINILRTASKACVVKREFKKAELLIRHAVSLVREHCGTRHPKYSDVLLDFGFYLLNVDSISQCTAVYQQALDIRLAAFGGQNLHVAVAHEDLAYASYVHQYSSGKFRDAKEHAEKAISIITQILPDDHLLLASSRRVKALILEELAIDSDDKLVESKLLQEAHDLHSSSLNLAIKAFGEFNVQTAKHYGNLGRLYQSMKKYKEAEKMHLKAIEIKENLLGEDDYEVALSVGHLASLYNYDMTLFDKAEKLYLRSISIGKKLFGPGYSGLEYDYRGLMRLYSKTNNFEKMMEYHDVLNTWNRMREKTAGPVDILEYLANCHSNFTTMEIVEKFFKMD
ncbi:Amyloid protein-binding protein 2 [Holothuria leucospilota]|uniref:Amyloid protein-binding protein 2 n=1 Tax=Holothuria leucospilota TaxID=206669 RepID=A0A9Q1CGB7_HOLLE|nr:Amyloid protein-binding protein 2 [Holothuria leucospilota]